MGHKSFNLGKMGGLFGTKCVVEFDFLSFGGDVRKKWWFFGKQIKKPTLFSGYKLKKGWTFGAQRFFPLPQFIASFFFSLFFFFFFFCFWRLERHGQGQEKAIVCSLLLLSFLLPSSSPLSPIPELRHKAFQKKFNKNQPLLCFGRLL